MSWTIEQLEVRPDLFVCEPYRLEGTHTITDDAGVAREFYLDHGWDNTFGYAFGTVLAVGAKVEEVQPGDFVHFTRHAYIPQLDEHGNEVLFVNKEDCLAIIEDEVDAKGVVEAGNSVDRDDA